MADVEPDVRVFEDAAALTDAAAGLFVDTVNRAIADRGSAMVCLSGGKTPRPLYELLSQLPYSTLLNWAQVHVFWGDERCVPPEDLNSNYRQAKDRLLGRVPIPPDRIHRVRTELGPEPAANDYAITLKKYARPPLGWPSFDLVLLGVGHDGHTASLFPGSRVEADGAVLAVETASASPPGWRITLTPLVFNSARRVVFLAYGTEKTKVVANVLYGEREPDLLPAQRIRPLEGNLVWMLDSAAASQNPAGFMEN
jgi:6-phosphogluconolactonase